MEDWLSRYLINTELMFNWTWFDFLRLHLQRITIHCNKLTLGKYIENLAHIWWFGFLRPPPQNRLLAASSRCNHPSAAPGKCCNHRTVPLIHWCNHRTVPLVHRCNHHTLPSVHWCNHCIVPLIHYSNHRTVRLVHWCNALCWYSVS